MPPITGPVRRTLWQGVVVGAIIAGIVLAFGLILLGLTGDFLVDWLWFSAMGYSQVFWTTVGTQVGVFLVSFAVSTAALWVNASLALRLGQSSWPQHPAAFDWKDVGAFTVVGLLEFMRHRLPWSTVILGGASLLAALIAWGEINNWGILLRFLYQVPYGLNDPLYTNDIGFYLFSLPAYIVIKNWMLLTLVVSALCAGAIYWVRGDIEFHARRRSVSPTAIAHGSVLLGLLFVVKAWSYNLDRYLLLYGDNGVVVGASYTDVHVELPILWLLIGFSIIAALVAWANVWVRTSRLLGAAALLVFGGSVVLSGVLPGFVERILVKPSELQREKPYIEYNIALTRQAYNLHQIVAKPFPAEQDLSIKALEANKATIDNIRLWDWQPLMDTYAQLQEIRTYYKFHDVDVDRYLLGDTYQGVMLSARELKSSLLPPNAQTWVNRHILFTHGNGVVMSPVAHKSPEGLPIFYLRDIPPVASGGPEIREPRIYYGEETDQYVVVKGSTPEFDYPKGKDNIYAAYTGRGDVSVGGIARRLLFAWYFSDVNLLLSNYITSGSQIMMRREIRERIQTIAPFLRLDHDPYLVITDGRLFWLQDAYTTSDYFPYAQPAQGFDLNYIRNSVKVIVDAYNGTVDFYITDLTEPIAATYQRIFPKLFKPLTSMPANLQKHIRYPEDLFQIQARLFQTYHMQDANVFYNREDLWQFPREPGGSAGAVMRPYYIIMRLPEESQSQFFLMVPMTPSRRDNMIAWLAARCDPPDYGKLIVYEFPKEKLVYGPFQIEALINQNTYISQQLSLWNQMGSRVIRGNLLVIPIENSILYVSPLYLRAQQGQLPELKRVIAAYGDRVVMKETLGEALSSLFVDAGPKLVAPSPETASALAVSASHRAREALDHYNRAIERLKTGDWAGFGGELEAMRGLLEEMSHQSGGR